MDEFFTWELLATYAGAALATGVVTQFLKDRLPRLPTQWLSYLVALAVLALATLFTTGVADAATLAMVPLNAVVVSLAANGGYSAVQRAAGGQR